MIWWMKAFIFIPMKASTPNKRPSPITEDPPPPAAFRKHPTAVKAAEPGVEPGCNHQ